MVTKKHIRVTVMSESQTEFIVFALNFGTKSFSNGPYKFEGSDFRYCPITNQMIVVEPKHNLTIANQYQW